MAFQTGNEDTRAGRNYASAVSKEFLFVEYAQLGRSILIHEIVGRVLSVLIILTEISLRLESIRRWSFVLVLIVLGALWTVRTEILRRRSQAMSKTIAESAYSENHEWGTFYIRSYQDRYGSISNAVGRFATRFEPVIWVVLSIVVLLWPTG
jgi:hypothetical protein